MQSPVNGIPNRPLSLAFEARDRLFQISKLFARENTGFVQAGQHLFSASKVVLHEQEFAVLLQSAPVFGVNLERCLVKALSRCQIWRRFFRCA
jgi:hypothetical protein